MKNKIINKKGFLGRDWVVGVLLFGGVIAFFFLMATSLGDKYNTQIIDAGFEGKYNKLSNTTAIISDAYDQLNSGNGLSLVGSFNFIFSATPAIVSFMFQSIAIVPGMLVSMGEDFGIPTIVTITAFSLFITIITAILIFVVISFITRGRL